MKKNNHITIRSLLIVLLGALFYFYDFVLQVSPGVMANNLLNDFNINATVLGAMMGLYFYSYTLMQIPAGLLLDELGAKRILPFVVIVCSLGAFCFAFSNHVYMLGLGRLLMGAGSAFAFLGALYLALRWLPAKYFAIFVGFTQTLGSLGAAAGETPFAYSINAIGWRHTMLLLGLIGIGLSIILFINIKEKHRPTSSKYSFTLAFLDMWSHLKTVLNNKQTWVIGMYSFAVWAPIASFAGLWGVPFLVTAYHITNIQASVGITIIWLGVAFACPAIGWISEKIQLRKIFLIILALIGFLSVINLIYFNHQAIWAIYLSLIGIGFAASGQSLAFAVIKDIQPLSLTGAGNGFNNMMIVLGGAIFQPMIGKLLDIHNHTTHVITTSYTLGDFHFALVVLPSLYVLAILMSCFFIKETYCKQLHHY